MSFHGFEHIDPDWRERTRETPSKRRKNKPLARRLKAENAPHEESQVPLTPNVESVGISPKHSSEHREQVALIKWRDRNRDRYPQLGAMYAVPNAGKRGRKARSAMLDEGLSAGVPDVCLPCPAGGFGALYIEMKYGRNKPTENQRAWIQFLRALGNRVEVCYSYEAARAVVCDYLNIEPETAP